MLGVLVSTFANVFFLPPIPKAQADTTTGLVGHWTFDGTANDASGQVNHGTFEGGTPSYQTGQVNQSLSFDGVDDNVKVPDPANGSLDFGTGDFTLAGWIKLPVGAATNRSILSKARGGTDFTGFNMWLDADTQAGGLELNVCDGASSATCGTVTGNADLRDNTWHHFVFIRTGNDRTNWKLYTDGVATPLTESGVDLSSGGDISNAIALRMAARTKSATDQPTNNLQGSLDDVRIYNRVLSPEEIKRLYNIGAGTKAGMTRTIVEDGLVGHWTFDGEDIYGTTALDASGQGNKGTLTNGPKPAKGKLGQALEFDGVDDYVEDGNTISFTASDSFSVSAWVYADIVDSTNRGIISKDGAGGTAPGWHFRVSSSNKIRFLVQSDGSNHRFADTSVISSGRWYHIVGVYNGTNTDTYLDGILDSSRSSSGILGDITTANNIRIGHARIPNNYFDGKLDDVRIYNRVLTPEEIKRIYNGTKESHVNVTNTTGSLEDGLVGHWSFDGNFTGPTWTDDVSGNGNRGTLVNGPKPVKGKLGQALEFDGTNDYVSLGDIFDPTGDITVSAWIYWERPDSFEMIVSKEGSLATGYSLQISVNSKAEFGVFNGSYPTATGVSTLAPNTWYHVLGVRNSAEGLLKIYVNGVEDGTAAAGSAPSSNDDSISVGRYKHDTNYFKGTIDDVRIYNRALSPEEIKRLYLLGNPTQ